MAYPFISCFFFKQKTAYEMLRSLVGSEMCIRDRRGDDVDAVAEALERKLLPLQALLDGDARVHREDCLLYTSDAADDLLCVDPGGRRILKKKNNPPSIQPRPPLLIHTHPHIHHPTYNNAPTHLSTNSIPP